MSCSRSHARSLCGIYNIYLFSSHQSNKTLREDTSVQVTFSCMSVNTYALGMVGPVGDMKHRRTMRVYLKVWHPPSPPSSLCWKFITTSVELIGQYVHLGMVHDFFAAIWSIGRDLAMSRSYRPFVKAKPLLNRCCIYQLPASWVEASNEVCGCGNLAKHIWVQPDCSRLRTR